MYWYQSGAGFGFWWILPVFFGSLWLIFFGLLAWVLVRVGRQGSARSETEAMTTLRERFARGEIEAEEFEQRSKLLAGSVRK